MVLVSVIMPSYNHDRFISSAINSVLCQSFQDIELIIVQDGKNDNIIRIIESYLINDPRVRVKIFDKNQGVSYAFNAGIEMA